MIGVNLVVVARHAVALLDGWTADVDHFRQQTKQWRDKQTPRSKMVDFYQQLQQPQFGELHWVQWRA